MESKEEYYLVIGLGISGLLITYNLAKLGKKVIAFETNKISADEYTASFGKSRVLYKGPDFEKAS
jgi:glycine/D-amino acid oxidase-like deaminating enzyme